MRPGVCRRFDVLNAYAVGRARRPFLMMAPALTLDLRERQCLSVMALLASYLILNLRPGLVKPVGWYPLQLSWPCLSS